MKILIIANLHSGKGRAGEFLPLIKNELQNENQIKIYATRDREHTEKLVMKKCNDYDMLIVLGGDGTLNEVVGGYCKAGCKKPIGYIPTGSTNDFANSNGLETDPVKAVRRFMKMNTVTIDAGLFGDRYFTYVAAAGAFSDTSYNTPRELKEQFGHFAYILFGLASIPTIKPLHLRITCDGKVTEGEYLIALVSNSLSVGGVFKLDSDLVSFNDGLFEVLLLSQPDSIFEFGSVLKDAIARNYDGDYITFLKGSEVTIESPDPVPWSLDGEFGGETTDITVKIIPNAITLLK